MSVEIVSIEDESAGSSETPSHNVPLEDPPHGTDSSEAPLESSSEVETGSSEKGFPRPVHIVLLICALILGLPTFAILDNIIPGLVADMFGLVLPMTALFIYSDYTRRSGEAAANSARQRLREAATPAVVYQAHEGGRIVIEGRDYFSSADPDTLEVDQTSIAERKILIEMYSQRVGQAQTWFRTSIVFGALGATVLLAGIILAIFHASSTGQRYAAIIASSASVVSNIIAVMFFRQSNIAQKMMAVQVEQIQASMKQQRDTAEARHRLAIALSLIEKIDNVQVRDQRRSDIAWELANLSRKQADASVS